MTISEWPEQEKPREKLLYRGAASLSDAELLAIFLRTGTRGHTAVDLARHLLSEHDGLRPLLDSDPRSLQQSRGLGTAKVVQLKAALALGRRYLETSLKRGAALTSPAATRDYLTARLRSYPHEVFACLFLDNRHQVIDYEELFSGTIDGASVHAREVVRPLPQRGGDHFRAQPPLRGGRAFRRRPRHHPAPARSPGAGGHPGAGSLHHRRR